MKGGLHMEQLEYLQHQLDLAKAVIAKYCITCRICAIRNCCDYEINQECNFKWDGESV